MNMEQKEEMPQVMVSFISFWDAYDFIIISWYFNNTIQGKDGVTIMVD